jgi:hypothetical protein
MFPHLKGYQHEVWNLSNYFNTFNITAIHRSQNTVADTLANISSRLTPFNNNFIVEILFIPSIPEKMKKWRVFNDDSQIIYFLTNVDVFQYLVIDDEVHEQNMQDYQDEASKIKDKCI